MFQRNHDSRAVLTRGISDRVFNIQWRVTEPDNVHDVVLLVGAAPPLLAHRPIRVRRFFPGCLGALVLWRGRPVPVSDLAPAFRGRVNDLEPFPAKHRASRLPNLPVSMKQLLPFNERK